MFRFLWRLFSRVPLSREERMMKLLQEQKNLHALIVKADHNDSELLNSISQRIGLNGAAINELATEIEMERRTKFIFECRRAGIKMSYLRAVDGDYLG